MIGEPTPTENLSKQRCRVVLEKCNDYEEKKVEEAVQKGFSLLGPLGQMIKPGDRVLLKVNMLRAAKPEEAVTTHPAVLKAIIHVLQDLRATPFIGDSPGNYLESSQRAWVMTGFQKVAQETGVKIVAFEKSGIQERGYPVGRFLKKFHFAPPVFDCELIINLPKLKTHHLTLYTGAIKNMLGSIAGFHKTQYHVAAPKPADFAEILVDIYSQVTPRITIMDAIMGMEGNGPSAGNPRKIGALLFSFDGVALDAVASSLIGYYPMEIDTTRIAAERGLGTASWENIKRVGDPYEELLVNNFRLPKTPYRLLRSFPPFLNPVLKRLVPLAFRIYPQAVKEKCTSCAICYENCPVKAIRMNDGFPVIDYQKCVRCYCCVELCPQGAIEFQRRWLPPR